MRKLKKITKILIIISIVVLLFCVVGVHAKNNGNNDPNINWNVSDGLKKTSENDICTSYKEGDYSFRICCKDDLSGYKKGFTKEENGMYYRFDVHVDPIKDSNMVGGYSDTLIGEYVKIGDKTYWVESSHHATSTGADDDAVAKELSSADDEKLRGYLTYFNEHNNANIVDV